MRSMLLKQNQRALDRAMERMNRLFPEFHSPLSMIDGIFDTMEKHVDGDITFHRYKLVPVEMEEWECPECGSKKLREKEQDASADSEADREAA